MTAASPVGLIVGGLTVATPGVSRGGGHELARAAVGSLPSGNSAASTNGPLKPAPKPSVVRS